MTSKNVNDYGTFFGEVLKTFPFLKRKNVRLQFDGDDGELVDIDNDPSFEGCINHFNIFEKKRKIVVYVKDEEPSRNLCFEDSTRFNYRSIEYLTPCTVPKLEKKFIYAGGKTNGIFLIAQCEHKGTEECGLKDYKKYIKIANHLGFSSKLGNLIEVEGKATWTKMEQELERCKKFVTSKLECFILVFIGHGTTYIRQKGGKIEKFSERLSMTEEIKDKTIPVDLQLLINKIESLKLPKECAKIILLEACRGGEDEQNHTIRENREFSEETSTTNMENLVICYATIPNKQAWCNNNGSFFTKHFHNEIMNISNELEFSQLLTRVNYLVNNNINENKDSTQRQLSCFRSSLTTELYFTHKK